jgi:hypothetical protein
LHFSLLNTAADYSKLDLQIHFEQLPQQGIISYGLQATPSGRQAKDPPFTTKVDGVKKAPAAINNAPTNFNNEVFFISFLLPKIKLGLNELRAVLRPDAEQTRLSH